MRLWEKDATRYFQTIHNDNERHIIVYSFGTFECILRLMPSQYSMYIKFEAGTLGLYITVQHQKVLAGRTKASFSCYKVIIRNNGGKYNDSCTINCGRYRKSDGTRYT